DSLDDAAFAIGDARLERFEPLSKNDFRIHLQGCSSRRGGARLELDFREVGGFDSRRDQAAAALTCRPRVLISSGRREIGAACGGGLDTTSQEPAEGISHGSSSLLESLESHGGFRTGEYKCSSGRAATATRAASDSDGFLCQGGPRPLASLRATNASGRTEFDSGNHRT